MVVLRHSPLLHLLALIILMLAVGEGRPGDLLPPDSGFGAWGEYEMVEQRIAHPSVNGNSVFFFTPEDGPTPAPLIIFCHGINTGEPRPYKNLIHFMVSKGFAVLYSSYSTRTGFAKPQAAYDQLMAGTVAGLKQWQGSFDTTRIGIAGHSYGGGAIPWMAKDFLTNRH